MNADVITLNLCSLPMTPLMRGNNEQLASHLVYAANGSLVQDVMIAGEIVMRDRCLTKVNEREVIGNANAAYVSMYEKLHGKTNGSESSRNSPTLDA